MADDARLDAELGRIARAGHDAEADAVDVDADWATFRARADSALPTAMPLRPVAPAGRTVDRRLVWMGAAAAAMLMLGGVVLAFRSGGDDTIRSATGSEVPALTTIGIPTTTVATDAVTSTTAVTGTTGFATTTVAPVVGVALATAVPTTIDPGDEFWITPVGAVTRNCGDVIWVAPATPDGGFADVGVLDDGVYSEPAAGRSCAGAETADSLTTTMPADMPPGEYRLCISASDVPEGCALVTVDGEPIGASPTSTTTTTVAGTATTTPVTTTPSACWRQPVAPPSLADGSPVGEPVVTDADKGTGTVAYTWGSGPFAVTQIVGAEPTPPGGAPSQWWGPSDAGWRSIHESTADGFVIHLHDTADGCTLAYRLAPDANFQPDDVSLIAGAWVGSLGSGTPIADGRHADLPSPVRYVGRRWIDADDSAALPNQALFRFAADGSSVEPVTADAATTGFPVDAGGGRRFAIDGEAYWYECVGGDVIGTDAAAVALVAGDGPVFSIAASPSGIVVVTRQTCADAVGWGDDGDVAEIVRYDLADAGAEVVRRIEPSSEPDEYWNDVWRVHTVDPDGRYVGVWESTSIEEGRFHVLDMLAGESSGEPLGFASSCADAGEIVGPPRFVDDDLVVLARSCGAGLDLTVDVVSLTGGDVVWGRDVEGGTASSYSGTIDGISATVVDGEVWILVTSGGFEDPGRTMLVHRDGQTEITRLGGFRDYAFTIGDLLTG